MPGTRLDAALVHRGLARSRTHAARLIADQRVIVAGRAATKAATPVPDGAVLEVEPGDDWASRGAYKLRGALDAFGIDVTGRRAVDVGASHGGFTDVLLRRGAAAVAAIDVGSGQLLPRLAADPRVHVVDATNARDLSTPRTRHIERALGGVPQLIVADVSFISLTLVLPALLDWAAAASATLSSGAAAFPRAGAEVVPMIKPQFEVGRDRLGAGGVVRDPVQRAGAISRVAACAAALGWRTAGVTASSLPGPSGNVEYFLHLRPDRDYPAGGRPASGGAAPDYPAADHPAPADPAADHAAPEGSARDGAEADHAGSGDAESERTARLVRAAVQEGPQ